MGNKIDEELSCLEVIQRRCFPIGNYANSIYKKISQITSDNEQEKPDMLFGSVGLEHFLVDIVHRNDKKAKSLSRPLEREVKKKIDKYMNNPQLLDDKSVLDSEKKSIQDIINNLIKGVSDYTPDRFFENFKRVYNKHLENALEYLKQCNELGFLIEIPYPSFIGQKEGYIIDGNQRRALRIPSIPKDILDYINEKHENISFIILYYRPIFSSKNNKDYKTIYINPNDVYSSIKKQSVQICKTFDYPCKYSNKDVLQFIWKQN